MDVDMLRKRKKFSSSLCKTSIWARRAFVRWSSSKDKEAKWMKTYDNLDDSASNILNGFIKKRRFQHDQG